LHASTQADFAGLLTSYLWVCGVLFALVVVLVALLLVRSRAGRPAPPSRTASHRASMIGLIALVAIAAFLITRTFSVEGREDSLAASTAARVDAIAFQWGWEFDYAGTSIRVIGLPGRTPTLVLPAGKPVEIRLRSRDVLHSFWVPALRFKRDAFPDQATRFDIEVPLGLRRGACALFCGLHHAEMRFWVRGVDDAHWASFLAGEPAT
jgi:cytochrome c oxidase subunit 2